jgi:hypothetical protein
MTKFISVAYWPDAPGVVHRSEDNHRTLEQAQWVVATLKSEGLGCMRKIYPTKVMVFVKKAYTAFSVEIDTSDTEGNLLGTEVGKALMGLAYIIGASGCMYNTVPIRTCHNDSRIHQGSAFKGRK